MDATRIQRIESATAAGDLIRDNARYVEGVGWVHEGSAPIPETARWVPGVGYVLEP